MDESSVRVQLYRAILKLRKIYSGDSKPAGRLLVRRCKHLRN